MIYIQELDGEVKEFPTNELAIECIKENNLQNYSIWNDTGESYSFLGGKLFMADNSEVFKIGNLVVKKV